MDRYKKLASNTLILAIGQFSSKFLVVIMMRFYTGTLNTDGYGTVGLIIDACVIITTVITLSINESIIRFGLDSKYDKAQVFSIGIFTVIIGLVLFAFAVPALNLIETFKGYAVWIYFYVAFSSIKSCCSLFARSAGYVKLFAIDGLFTTVMNIVFNLVFMLGFGLGVKGFLLSVILADVSSTIFVFCVARLKSFLNLRFLKPRTYNLNPTTLGAMFRYSIPLIPTAIMWWITQVSAGFFIENMIGIESTGVYKAAYRFPNIIIIVSLIFSQAWNMSAITEKNSRTIARFYTNVFNIFQSAVYIMAAGLLLVIRVALAIMTTADFGDAYKYASILTVAVVFSCFSTFAGSVYVASKKSVRSMSTAIVGAVINILLNIVLIPIWGLYGAAFATFISYLIIFIVRAFDTRKIVLMDLKVVKMISNSLILLVMGIIVITVRNNVLYYALLSVLFVAVAAINFKSAINAIRMVTKKGEVK